jgi:integrase
VRGHLRQRGKSGVWYAVLGERDPITGRRRRRWLNLKTTGKRRAEIELAKILTQHSEGGLPPPGRVTVGDLVLSYIESRGVAGRAPRTIQLYELLARKRLLPAIGHLRAADLRPADVEHFYATQLPAGRLDGREGPLSPTTVHRMHALLHAALRRAVRQGLCLRNAADAVTPPQATAGEQRVLQPAEVRALLDRARNHRLFGLLFLALSTGMRQGELIGLRWSDVDLEAGLLTVRVQRQYVTGAGIQERPTKGYRGDRPVELTADELLVLTGRRAAEAQERRRAEGVWEDHGLVFPSEVGTPLNPRNVVRWYKHLLQAAGLPPVRFHDLRHTAATLLLRADGRVLTAQRRLDHRDPGTTTRLYGHVLPGDQRAAAERVVRDVLRPSGGARGPVHPPRRERVAKW